MINKTDRKSIIKDINLVSFTRELPIFDESKVFWLETLGEGAFGVVQKAYDKTRNEFVALKKFKNMEYPNKDDVEVIMMEDALLQSVEKIRKSKSEYNQYFLKYDGVFKSSKETNDLILMMENGIATLEDILKAGKRYSCDELLYVLRKMANAFLILEENGIANRDVKIGNVILVEDQNEEGTFYYKISDFGIGCKLENGINIVGVESLSGLTREYAAPEVLRFLENEISNSDVYNPFLADVFSMGVVALKMIDYNFKRKNFDSILQKKSLSGYEQIIELLEGMLEEDPLKRWNFKKILKYLKEKRKLSKSPIDELEYCHKWQIEMKEQKMENSYENLQKLYEEHDTMFSAYQNTVTRPKEAKFHLDRVKDILSMMQEQIEENGSQEEKMLLMEKRIQNLNNFGEWYRGMGKFKSSEKKIFQAMAIIEEYRTIEYDQYKDENKIDQLEADVLNTLACLFDDMGNLPKAEEYYLKSLKILQNIFGMNHSDVADSLNNLGSLYDKRMGDLPKAEEYYLKAFKIRQNLFGQNHSDVALSLNSLGLLYNHMGDFKKAEEYFIKSLEIYENTFGENHSDVAMALNNLGMLYRNMGDFLKAEKYYLKSLKIRKILFGENSTNTATSLSNLSYIYEALNKKELTLEDAKSAFVILENLYGNSHKKTVKYWKHYQELLIEK